MAMGLTSIASSTQKHRRIVADYVLHLAQDLAECSHDAGPDYTKAGLSALFEEISKNSRTCADLEMSLGRFTAVCERSPEALEMLHITFVHFRKFLVERLRREEDLIEEMEPPRYLAAGPLKNTRLYEWWHALSAANRCHTVFTAIC